jgi:hypothetical protein
VQGRSTPVVSGEFSPLGLIEVLVQHEVRFVVIGGFAAAVHGSPTTTQDLDICHARDDANLRALAAALSQMGARLRGVDEQVPFKIDARALKAGDSFTFQTTLGDLDCLATPAGTRG